MMLKIYVTPDDVWDYFQKNKKRLGNNLDVIAEIEIDDKSGLQVFLTEENQYPQFTIEYDDDVLVKECAISEDDCSGVVQKLYIQAEELFDLELDDRYDAEMQQSVVIDSRHEQEITNALEILLRTAMGDEEFEALAINEEELSEIMDAVEETLWSDFGYIIQRPRVVEDENGNCYIQSSLFDEEGAWW